MKLMPISFPCSFAGLPVYVASSQSAPFIMKLTRLFPQTSPATLADLAVYVARFPAAPLIRTFPCSQATPQRVRVVYVALFPQAPFTGGFWV